MLRHFKICLAVAAALAASSGGAALAAEDAAPIDAAVRQPQGGSRHGVPEVRTSGEITHVLSVTHRWMILQERIAVTRARSPEVREYARTMLKAHSAAFENAQAFVGQQRIKPEKSKLSALVAGNARLVVSYLKQQPEKSFDRAFMLAEVMAHHVTLKLLDGRLIPAAQDKEVREELSRQRAEVARHLKKASVIYRHLGKVPAGQQTGTSQQRRGR